MYRFLQGDYWSGSGIYLSGSAHDLITVVETSTGRSPVIAKKIMRLCSGSSPMSVKINNGAWSAVTPNDSGSYILSTGAGDVMASHIYVQQGSASGLDLAIIY